MERETLQHVSSQAFQPILKQGSAPQRQEGAGRYPFSEPEWRSWWDQCHPSAQKDWAPILRLMTGLERNEFHRYRKAKAFTWPDTTPGGRVERDDAEQKLIRHWQERTAGRTRTP